MKKEIKPNYVIACFVIILLIGLLLGMTLNQEKETEFEKVDSSIRFYFSDEDTTGIWKPVFHKDGSWIGFAIYEIDDNFKTFIHINETIKAELKLCK